MSRTYHSFCFLAGIPQFQLEKIRRFVKCDHFKLAQLPMSNLRACNSTHNTTTHSVSRRVFITHLLAISALPVFLSPTSSQGEQQIKSTYDITVTKDDKPFKLESFQGKLTLFVNVATYCALTPQYEGLVTLHDKYKPEGFEVIASPCDQFGHQEPGSNQEICQFAKQQFGAKFLLLDKLNVNDGPGGVSLLYRYLKENSPEGTGRRVSWNFEKFLVASDGHVLRRYKPGVLPDQLESDIKWAIAHPGQDLPPKPKPSLGVA